MLSVEAVQDKDIVARGTSCTVRFVGVVGAFLCQVVVPHINLHILDGL